MICANIHFLSDWLMCEYSAILNQMVAEVGTTFLKILKGEEFLKDYRSD